MVTAEARELLILGHVSTAVSGIFQGGGIVVGGQAMTGSGGMAGFELEWPSVASGIQEEAIVSLPSQPIT